jgi:hypothetical protein
MVVLGVENDQVDAQHWEPTPLLGMPEESDTTAPKEDVVTGTGDAGERGAWSPAADAYTIEPLDTADARLATEGIDDGEPQKLQDLSG